MMKKKHHQMKRMNIETPVVPSSAEPTEQPLPTNSTYISTMAFEVALAPETKSPDDMFNRATNGLIRLDRSKRWHKFGVWLTKITVILLLLLVLATIGWGLATQIDWETYLNNVRLPNKD